MKYENPFCPYCKQDAENIQHSVDWIPILECSKGHYWTARRKPRPKIKAQVTYKKPEKLGNLLNNSR